MLCRFILVLSFMVLLSYPSDAVLMLDADKDGDTEQHISFEDLVREQISWVPKNHSESTMEILGKIGIDKKELVRPFLQYISIKVPKLLF